MISREFLVPENHNDNTNAHCSYLDIYISRKIRFCVVDLEGKFQTNLQAKLLNFLVWKFRSITPIFLLFFAEFVKSSAFYTLLLLFQRVDMFDAKNTCDIMVSYFSPSCLKHTETQQIVCFFSELRFRSSEKFSVPACKKSTRIYEFCINIKS